MAKDSSNTSHEEQQIREIVYSLTPQARELLGVVLRFEKEKLHMKNPIGIVDDITSNAKALIK